MLVYLSSTFKLLLTCYQQYRNYRSIQLLINKWLKTETCDRSLFVNIIDDSTAGHRLHGDRGEARSKMHFGHENKKALLSQRRPRDAQIAIYGCPEKFRESSQTPPATFPEICKQLMFRSILRMCVQNLKFVALFVPEIIGGTQKFGQSLDTPTLQFLPNF